MWLLPCPSRLQTKKPHENYWHKETRANREVYAAAVDGSGHLYIGGNFTTVGNILATNAAQWNESAWSALGWGMNYYMNALAVSGSALYAGDYFTTAGTNVSAYATMANLPASIAILNDDAAFGFNAAGPTGSNVIVQASTDLLTWI
jgi:hypothetical protein